MADTAPLTRTLEATVPAAGAAVTQDQSVGEAPFAGAVSEVTVISEAAVVAHATNYRTLRLINKGQAGAGSTVVASFPLDTPTTDDLAAFDEKTIPITGTATVVEGDVLATDETVAGTGVAHSGYKVQVTVTRS